jgi:hypothetical protein
MHIHPTVTELVPTMLGELKPLEPTSDEPPLNLKGANPEERSGEAKAFAKR